MNMYYPIMLQLAGRRCTVVGGGRVAERKINSLLQHGGQVTVISPKLTPHLLTLAQGGKIQWQKRFYEKGLLRGSELIITATDDPLVSQACCEEARALGIMINVVDMPERGDFIIPAIHRQNSLTFAVSTEGKSPLLSRAIVAELAQRYGKDHGHLVDILGKIRERAQLEIKDSVKRKELYEILVQAGLTGTADLWEIYEAFKYKEGEENENH